VVKFEGVTVVLEEGMAHAVTNLILLEIGRASAYVHFEEAFELEFLVLLVLIIDEVDEVVNVEFYLVIFLETIEVILDDALPPELTDAVE
jgi:hypothetical protein